MTKYRFKTKTEFIRDGQWESRYSAPINWDSGGGMNYLIGQAIPVDIINSMRGFLYKGWTFRSTDITPITETESSAEEYSIGKQMMFDGEVVTIISPVKDEAVVIIGHSSFTATLTNHHLKDNDISIAHLNKKARKVYVTALGPLPHPKEQSSSISDSLIGQYVKTDDKNNTVLIVIGQGRDNVICLKPSGWVIEQRHCDEYNVDPKYINHYAWSYSKSRVQTINKPITLKTENHEQEINNSVKVCKPYLQISTGVRARGIGLKSSGSKIKLGNHHRNN